MGKASTAGAAMVVAIALYFTLAWGLDGIQALTAPSYGLDDVWRAQVIFEIGRYAGLDPVGLLKLAAFFAALKVAVAGFCALHIIDRFRAFAGGKARAELLEGALIIVVAISIVSAGPAIWSHNTQLLRESVVQLGLAAVATALCLFERRSERADVTAANADEKVAAMQKAGWFSPLR